MRNEQSAIEADSWSGHRGLDFGTHRLHSLIKNSVNHPSPLIVAHSDLFPQLGASDYIRVNEVNEPQAVAPLERTPFLTKMFGLPEQIFFEPDEVFVLMPFEGVDMDESYTEIKTACAGLDLHASRADDTVGSNLILREVADKIRRAEFLIFDLSHERPNVYYELGYAHGIGNDENNVLMIAQADSPIHFDVAPFRVHKYKSAKDLGKILTINLKGMMGVSRRRK